MRVRVRVWWWGAKHKSLAPQTPPLPPLAPGQHLLEPSDFLPSLGRGPWELLAPSCCRLGSRCDGRRRFGGRLGYFCGGGSVVGDGMRELASRLPAILATQGPQHMSSAPRQPPAMPAPSLSPSNCRLRVQGTQPGVWGVFSCAYLFAYLNACCRLGCVLSCLPGQGGGRGMVAVPGFESVCRTIRQK